MLNEYQKISQSQTQVDTGKVEQIKNEGIETLQKEWGATFQDKINVGNATIGQFEANDLTQLQLADGRMLGDHPAFVKAFVGVGDFIKGKIGEDSLEGQFLLKADRLFVRNITEKEVGSHARKRALSLAYCFNCEHFLNILTDADEFEWDEIFGEGGCLLTEASLAYDFDSFHHLVKNQHSWDGNVRPTHVYPLILHYGDLDSANANADRALAGFKRMLRDPTPCGATMASGCC